MLKELAINGYRHFADFKINFTENTIICGTNGSGKTSLVELAAKLRDFILNKNTKTAGEMRVSDLYAREDVPAWERSLSHKHFADFSITLEHGGNSYVYSLGVFIDSMRRIHRVDSGSLAVNGETVLTVERQGQVSIITDYDEKMKTAVDWNISSIPQTLRYNAKIREFFKIIANGIYAVSINHFEKVSPYSINCNMPCADASNFGAWYDGAIKRRVGEISELFQIYKRFIPGFVRFIIKGYYTELELFAEIEDTEAGSFLLPYDSFSKGMKALCVIHMIYKTAENNSTVFIDDFENNIYTAEINNILDAIETARKEKNIQTVLVSKHNKVLSRHPEQIQILRTEGNPPRVEAWPLRP